MASLMDIPIIEHLDYDQESMFCSSYYDKPFEDSVLSSPQISSFSNLYKHSSTVENEMNSFLSKKETSLSTIEIGEESHFNQEIDSEIYSVGVPKDQNLFFPTNNFTESLISMDSTFDHSEQQKNSLNSFDSFGSIAIPFATDPHELIHFESISGNEYLSPQPYSSQETLECIDDEKDQILSRNNSTMSISLPSVDSEPISFNERSIDQFSCSSMNSISTNEANFISKIDFPSSPISLLGSEQTISGLSIEETKKTRTKKGTKRTRVSMKKKSSNTSLSRRKKNRKGSKNSNNESIEHDSVYYSPLSPISTTSRESSIFCNTNTSLITSFKQAFQSSSTCNHVEHLSPRNGIEWNTTLGSPEYIPSQNSDNYISINLKNQVNGFSEFSHLLEYSNPSKYIKHIIPMNSSIENTKPFNFIPNISLVQCKVKKQANCFAKCFFCTNTSNSIAVSL